MPSQTNETAKVSRSKPVKKVTGLITRARSIVRIVVMAAIIIGLFVAAGLGSLSSFGIGAVAYLCPLGALATMFASHSVIIRVLISFICIGIIVALLGRAFCSWVCPVPPLRRFFHPSEKKAHAAKTNKAITRTNGLKANSELSDAADGEEPDLSSFSSPNSGLAPSACAAQELTEDEKSILRASLNEQKESACSTCSTGCKALAPLGGKRDGFHFDSRHGVLAGALVSSLIFGFPVFCLVCPVGLSIAFIVSLYQALVGHNPTLSILIFAAIIAVEVIFFRKWCHKVCPLGALMSLIGVKAPLARPRVKAKSCLRNQGIDCEVCVHTCPEELDPHTKSIPECTRCGRCVEACPAHAISLSGFRLKEKVRSESPE
ncbi:MAG: 4Fe-4S binding protein [Eggerthellaceae bacterium]|nr:4Fe-4S binding protein [Eggerthellaceae bacterium]